MNNAARVVIYTLAFVVIAYTSRTVLSPWVGPELTERSLHFFDLALGALIGVIGKTAYDAASAAADSAKQGNPTAPVTPVSGPDGGPVQTTETKG
jgi:hypothetical protein